jgi:heme/copper-type cytochrome/quinol oxidase subunit 3
MQMEQQLTREQLQDLKKKRDGLVIFQISWIMVFVCLVVVNIQLRGNFASWPPPGVEKLGIVLPTIATVALIASGFFTRRAASAIKTDERSGFLTSWRIALVLGLIFVALMAVEWLIVPVSGQYSTLFRVMTAFHAFHALVIGLYMFRTLRFAQAGLYGATDFWSVEAGRSLWDFVIVAWLMFYAIIYWI